MRPITFLEAPICAGSPTDGSQYAYRALKEDISALLGEGAAFCDQAPAPIALSPSPPNLRCLFEVTETANRLYRTALRLLGQGGFPLVIGGDHSVAMGSMAAAAEQVGARDLSVVWIDGHTDINTEQTTMTGCIHGMPLAQALGACSDALWVGREKVHLYGQNITIVGARSVDEGEYQVMAQHGVRMISAAQIKARGIEAVMREVIDRIKTPYVHLSFDVDCMDGEVFPATGYRMAGGMTKYEAFYGAEALFADGRVISMDLVEYNPLLDKTGKGKADLLELIGLLAHRKKQHLDRFLPAEQR